MAFFQSHREEVKATNRTLGRFFLVMAVWTLAFAALVAEHYLLGW